MTHRLPRPRSAMVIRKRWNGTIRAPLLSDEWERRMEQTRKFLLDGTLPTFSDRKTKNKLIFQARHKYFLNGNKFMFKKSGKDLEVVAEGAAD